MRGGVLAWTVIGVLLVLVAVPFYWMVNTSLKTSAQVQSLEPYYYPSPVTLSNYGELLRGTNFPLWIRNSATVALGATLVTVVVSCLAGYSLTRIRYPGRRVLATTVLIVYLVPPTLLFIPLYTILRGLGLANTLWALLVVYPTFTVPFCTWLLMGFFRSIPPDLEAAAMVDGANRLQAFRRVILPLAAPGVLAAGLFAFTLAWNEFLYALVFINDTELKTIPVGLNDLMFGDIFLWGQLMAASVLTTVPVVVLYTYLQRYMVEGLTAGAVKG
ncbi:MAG: sugar ABC transporter permease [Candidatus Rokuibacteriota bacterium]|nr:MAG: sugar ABC transporter permease [Candidatus Rokubacteria bacterium]